MNATKILALSAAAFLAGCQPREQPVETAGDDVDYEAIDADLMAVYMEANEFMMGGETNAAIKILGDTLADKRYARHGGRQMLLDYFVRASFGAGQGDEALATVVALCESDLDLGLQGLGLVYENVRQQLPPDEILAWITAFAKNPKLPAAALQKAVEWEILAALDLREDDRAVTVLAAALAKRPEAPELLQLAQRSVAILLDGRHGALSKLIDALAGIKAAPVQNLRLAAQVRLAAATGDWDAYAAFMKTAIATLPDPPLYSLCSQTLSQAKKAGQFAMLNTLAKTLVAAKPKKPSSTRLLAQAWAEDAKNNNPADFPNRLQTMIDADMNPGDAFDILHTFFYAIPEQIPPEVLKKMIVQGETLRNKIEAANPADTSYSMTIPLCLLDMAFTVNDFDATIRILEKGIPEKDEPWHKMGIVKVKAHRAMFNDQNAEAAGYFREFMALLAEHGKEEDLVDPIKNLTLPKEAVLARNALRVGELLAETDPAAANAARAEAVELFKAAVEQAKYPEIKELVEQELQALQK